MTPRLMASSSDLAVAVDGQPDVAVARPADEAPRRLRGSGPPVARPSTARDDVPGEQSGCQCRRASGRTSTTRRAQRLVDDRAAASSAILDAHARADALELAADVGERRGELVGAEVGRVGVVERLEHAPHGAFQQLARAALRRRTRRVMLAVRLDEGLDGGLLAGVASDARAAQAQAGREEHGTAERQEHGRDDDGLGAARRVAVLRRSVGWRRHLRGCHGVAGFGHGRLRGRHGVWGVGHGGWT